MTSAGARAARAAVAGRPAVLSATAWRRLLQRLIEGPAVGLGDDLDQMGQSIGRGRGSPLLDDLAGGSLGVAEQVIGDRQAEEPLERDRGHGRLLPAARRPNCSSRRRPSSTSCRLYSSSIALIAASVCAGRSSLEAGRSPFSWPLACPGARAVRARDTVAKRSRPALRAQLAHFMVVESPASKLVHIGIFKHRRCVVGMIESTHGADSERRPSLSC